MHSDITDLCNVIGAAQSVYLSGPMSNREHNNAEEFAKWHAILREVGITDVYDPVHEWMTDDGDKSHAEYLRRTIHELTRPEGYDRIIMLPGWEWSLGACTEKNVADACGIHALYVLKLGTKEILSEGVTL